MYPDCKHRNQAEGQRDPHGPPLKQTVFKNSCLSPSLRGRKFLWGPLGAMSLCSEANFSVNFCGLNFSPLISPLFHFICFTHFRNSSRWLIYWLYPFWLLWFLNGLIFFALTFSAISMKFGLNSHVKPPIWNHKSILLSCVSSYTFPHKQLEEFLL